MAYTPELKLKHSQTLRRIAWAMDMPMTKAIAEIFDWLIRELNSEQICKKCRDKSRCESCPFNKK